MTIYHKYKIGTGQGLFAIQNGNITFQIFQPFLTDHGCLQNHSSPLTNMKIKFISSSIHMGYLDQCFSTYSYQINQRPSNYISQPWRKTTVKCLHLIESLMNTGLVLPLPIGKTVNDFLKSGVKFFFLSPSPFSFWLFLKTI